MKRIIYVLSIAFFMANFSGCGESKNSKIPREEFKVMVTGKTQDEVIALVGKPIKTNEFSGLQCWYYEEKTFDPLTEKVDRQTQVCFENGIAVSPNF